MHPVDGYAEIEPGLTLPVFNPNELIATKDQLRLVVFSRQETVLRYCRYSSKTVDLLGLRRTIELGEKIFEKAAVVLGAVVTPHTVGVVEYNRLTESTNSLKLSPRIKQNLVLVQEVDVVRPSINIAHRLR